MTRAKRLLTLAYKAHQRNEPEIAGRIMTFAFAEPEAAKMFEQLNETSTQSTTQPSGVAKAEAALRAAEAATTGKLFSDAGASRLLAIADKAHKDGLPQIAKLIADIAS